MEKIRKQAHPSAMKIGKRTLAFFSDLFIFLILASLFYSFVSFNILKTTSFYKINNDAKDVSYEICRSLIKGSRLVSFDENEKEQNLEETFKKDIEVFTSNKVVENSKYNEMFYYFYLDFGKNKLNFTYDVNYVNSNVFKVGGEESLFELDGEIVKIQNDISKDLTTYLSGEVTATNEESYNKFITFMKSAWNDASKALTDSSTFVKEAKAYNDTSYKVLLSHSITALITFTVFYFLYYLLVPVLFKKGQTLGKKLLRMGIFYEDDSPIKNRDLILRSLLNYLLMLFFYPSTCLFTIGFSCLFMPIVYTGEVLISAMIPCFVCGIVAIVSYFFIMNDINHRSLADITMKTIVLKEYPDYIEENLINGGDSTDGSVL